jgi:hypothetical protein
VHGGDSSYAGTTDTIGTLNNFTTTEAVMTENESTPASDTIGGQAAAAGVRYAAGWAAGFAWASAPGNAHRATMLYTATFFSIEELNPYSSTFGRQPSRPARLFDPLAGRVLYPKSGGLWYKLLRDDVAFAGCSDSDYARGFVAGVCRWQWTRSSR